MSDPGKLHAQVTSDGVPLIQPSHVFDMPDSLVQGIIIPAGRHEAVSVVQEDRVNLWQIGTYFWPEIATVTFLIVLLLVLYRVWRIVRDARLVGDMYCRRCKYNLNGIERPTCPECGRDIQGTNRRVLRSKRRRLMVPGVLGILVFGAIALMLYRDNASRNLGSYRYAIVFPHLQRTFEFSDAIQLDVRSTYLAQVFQGKWHWIHRYNKVLWVNLNTGERRILWCGREIQIPDGATGKIRWIRSIDVHAFAVADRVYFDSGDTLFHIDSAHGTIENEYFLGISEGGRSSIGEYSSEMGVGVEGETFVQAIGREELLLIRRSRGQVFIWSLSSNDLPEMIDFPPALNNDTSWEVRVDTRSGALFLSDGERMLAIDLEQRQIEPTDRNPFETDIETLAYHIHYLDDSNLHASVIAGHQVADYSFIGEEQRFSLVIFDKPVAAEVFDNITGQCVGKLDLGGCASARITRISDEVAYLECRTTKPGTSISTIAIRTFELGDLVRE